MPQNEDSRPEVLDVWNDVIRDLVISGSFNLLTVVESRGAKTSSSSLLIHPLSSWFSFTTFIGFFITLQLEHPLIWTGGEAWLSVELEWGGRRTDQNDKKTGRKEVPRGLDMDNYSQDDRHGILSIFLISSSASQVNSDKIELVDFPFLPSWFPFLSPRIKVLFSCPSFVSALLAFSCFLQNSCPLSCWMSSFPTWFERQSEDKIRISMDESHPSFMSLALSLSSSIWWR